MKLLIDTDWAMFAQDLSPEKELELYRAIMNYPNSECSLKCWETIKPILEKGRISYFNKVNNLKKGGIQEHLKNHTERDTVPSTDSVIGSDTESTPNGTPNGKEKEKENNNINNNINNNTQSSKKKEKKIIKEKKEEVLTEFDIFAKEFWTIYPKARRDSEKKVKERLRIILKNKQSTMDELLTACKNYARSWEAMKNGGVYAKGTLAWLNGEYWERDWVPVDQGAKVAAMTAKDQVKAVESKIKEQEFNQWMEQHGF